MHQLPIFPARKPARFPLRLLWKMFLLTKQWMHHPCQILCRSPVPIASSKLCSCSPDARIARMVTGGEIGRSACLTMLIAAAALRQDSWDTQRQVMRVSSRHWHELYKQPHLSFFRDWTANYGYGTVLNFGHGTKLELVGGLEHFFIVQKYWECHHPNWLLLHDFSEGLAATTNQIHILIIINHIINI